MTNPKNTLTSATLLLTALTMTFFAANSLLARLALSGGGINGGEIDGGAFTAIRIFAGAVTLGFLVAARGRGWTAITKNGSPLVALALFGYAIFFSYAYLTLSAATGALILFAAVQLTMLGAGFVRGHKPRLTEWIGLILAFSGLVYLVLPGVTAPSPGGVALMASAGVAWGVYSFAAKGVQLPIATFPCHTDGCRCFACRCGHKPSPRYLERLHTRSGLGRTYIRLRLRPLVSRP